jgi:hypothetical protein
VTADAPSPDVETALTDDEREAMHRALERDYHSTSAEWTAVFATVERILALRGAGLPEPSGGGAVEARIVERADRLLERGAFVYEPGSSVAYAFVVPVSVRDDLADAFGDLAQDES